MSRARATALALVNWKGVFYERYLLDKNVTALEGANGAGKTTVMIAAYVVLLPDLSRLRFTNLGETGATAGDKGIWGRLGDPARPSYAALQIELGDHKRVLIGVHLERKTEPALSLSPFLISDLSDDIRVQDLLLVQTDAHDEIPTLDQVKASVAARGARLQVFGSAKEYFAKLFELGIGPLRLGTEEERNKWNEMLRTSMTGGISRALTSELRSFVFKHDTGLSDTLGRMRSNLSTCRQTRTEVGEARVLEHEISGIYDSGLGFFALAFLAAREQAREAQASFREAARGVEETRAQLNALEAKARECDSRRATLQERVLEAERARIAASEAVRQIERARQVQARLATLEPELLELQERARAAAAERDAATAERRSAIEERDRALVALRTTAEGLAHLQVGLDELHKQVYAHRRATREFELLQAKLKLRSAEPEALAAAEVAVSTELTTIDAELARRDRELGSLEIRRAEEQAARAALIEIDAAEAKAKGPLYARAKAQLLRLAELELSLARVSDLPERQQTAIQLGLRQQALQRRLDELGWEPEVRSAAACQEWVRARENFCQELEEPLRKSEWQIQVNVALQAKLEAELEVLERRTLGWERARALAARVSGGAEPLELRREVVRERRRALELERDQVQRSREAAGRELERLSLAVSMAETGEGAYDAALLEVCDRLEGELLARRYDEVSVAEGRHLEAVLGPLVNAVVVEDLDAAVDLLHKEPPSLGELWLVRSGEPVTATEPTQQPDIPGYVSVETASGLRVTRLPDRPRLGEKARERDLQEWQEESQRAQLAQEALGARLDLLERAARDVAELQESVADWLPGDPAPEVVRLNAELSELETSTGELRERVATLQVELSHARSQAEAGRLLLGDAHLLDAEDQTALGSLLGDALAKTRETQAEVLRVASARQRLSDLLPALHQAVPEADEIARWQRERSELEARRDELFSLREALVSLESNRAALGWGDAERALVDRVELAPELEAAHARAGAEAQAAEGRVATVEQKWERTTRSSQQASAQLEAAQAHRERMSRELEFEGAPEASDEALAASMRRERLAAQRVGEIGAEAATNAAEVGRIEERMAHARARCDAQQAAARSFELAANPAQEVYERTVREASAAGLLHAVTAEPFQSDYAGWSSDSLWAEARSKSSLLALRLETARGGEALGAKLNSEVRSGVTATSALALWQEVRAWLSQRVPARIADAGDPLEALHRLREDLRSLETRLSRQETDLRGNSEDVARNIDVQTRRAGNQVRRLNQYLRPIQFGSIAGIRIKMGRVERMDQVLTALRDGAAQALLFQSNLPIEEALDEIFKRYGGGRGGGHRLLDYREYIELSVEIQRQRDAAWELANPSRLSTGEAIGVGAALMMVILTEWERDANLLRAERTQGTLRFLFLDEANRLSRDNLSTLFELCQNLDLQLLVAAPEVAHVDGNTTYRLVRRINEEGAEEVVASGRRASLPESADAASEPAVTAASQPTLGL